MNQEKVREITIRIVVPSADREGRPEEACLYGSEYYTLKDAVVGVEFGAQKISAQPTESASSRTS